MRGPKKKVLSIKDGSRAGMVTRSKWEVEQISTNT